MNFWKIIPLKLRFGGTEPWLVSWQISGIIPSPLCFEESTGIYKHRNGTYAPQPAKSEHLSRKGRVEGEKRDLEDEETRKIRKGTGPRQETVSAGNRPEIHRPQMENRQCKSECRS